MSTPGRIVPTDIPGLDMVLGGGLISGSLAFLVGAPGAGKTIMASQIIFNVATEGTPALILTAFSEGSVKLLEHLQALSFFDGERVGNAVTILSLVSIIGDDVEKAAANIVRTIRQSKARMVVIDGFQGVAGLLGAEETIRRTLADIANLLSFLDVIVLITFEGDGRNPADSALLTTADAVIGLHYGVVGNRHRRNLDVIKQRGSAPLSGLHPYAISSDGITVYPRLESRPLTEAPQHRVGSASFGLPELDDLLHGGLTLGTTTLLAGAPGVGKTTLGLIWGVCDATPESSTLFVNFGEYPSQLQRKAVALGLDLDAKLESDALQFLRLSPIDIEPDRVAAVILSILKPGTTRLIIDDLAGLLHALGDRGGVFLSALTAHCYARDITTLLLLEIEALSGLRLNLTNTALSLVAENVILLQQIVAAGRLHRMLAVLKMRYSDYDQTLREVVLDQRGVRVLTPAQTTIGVLDEAAETAGGFSPDSLSSE